MGKWLVTFFAIGAVFFVALFVSLLFITVGWSLFMVPVFGLPNLTFMQALGFSFLISALRANTPVKKD